MPDQFGRHVIADRSIRMDPKEAGEKVRRMLESPPTEIGGIPQVEGLAFVRGMGATVVGDRMVLVGSAETSTTT